MRSIGQSCAVSGTLYLFFACLYNSLICKHRSVIFPCYFCLSFSESLSSSAERHKNSSHERFTDFYQSKCHHCHRLFLLFCFCKTISYCQSVFLLLLFHNHLKTVCKIQCSIHISFFLPVQIVFCDLAIRFLHYQCSI